MSTDAQDGQMESGTEGQVAKMADSLFVRIAEIKRDHPEAAQRIDALELELRQSMESLQGEFEKIDEKRSRDLLTVLLINDIHRAIESILSVS